MGAYIKKDVSQKDLETVFTYFPRLKERRKQIAGTFRRRAADAGHVPRPHEPPEAHDAGRASMGLAPILVDQIFDIIKELHKAGTTILLVEQTPGRRCRLPTVPTFWKPAASP